MLTTLARRAAATLAIVIAGAGQAASVYRCDTGHGVEYRDQPCAEDARSTVVSVAPAGVRLVLTHGHPLDAMSPGLDGPVAPGMSPRAVYQSLGRPVDMNVRIEGILPIERWWYRTPEGMLTVTFRQGRVVSAVTR